VPGVIPEKDMCYSSLLELPSTEVAGYGTWPTTWNTNTAQKILSTTPLDESSRDRREEASPGFSLN